MAKTSGEIDPGRFWSAVRACSQNALRAGALQPISTVTSHVPDAGVEFVVRLSDNLLRKPGTQESYHHSRIDNPFLPPDPLLTVGSLPPHHVAVLNKFNVLEDHVLVVTRGFVHQESPLTAADFAAVAAGLGNRQGLAFYNAGKIAGASQPHKHLQLVPLPLGRRRDIPMEALFDDADFGIDTVTRLRFRHALLAVDAPVDEPVAFGAACSEAYATALRGLGMEPDIDGGEEGRLPPYNLLLTDHWLFVAPRREERSAGISINGLGYAGSLFVSTREKLDYATTRGPMKILEDVSVPRPE